jgi:hypothetical protein
MQTKCRWVDTEDAMQCSQRGDCIGLEPRNDLLSRVIAHQFHPTRLCSMTVNVLPAQSAE